MANTAPRTLNWRRLLPLAVIVAVAIYGYVEWRDLLSFPSLAAHQAQLEQWRDANYLPTVAGFMLVYVAIVAFSLPGAAVISITGGLLFGLFPGVVFNVVSATIGATAIFLAAKWGLGDYLSSRVAESQGKMRQIQDGLQRNQISFLLLMRLVPAFPFFLANLVPAFSGIGLRNFVWTTFVGIIPGGLVYTWIGSGFGEVLARGEAPNLGMIFEWQILLPILGLCALSLLPVVLRQIRRART